MADINKSDDGFHIGDDLENPLAKIEFHREANNTIVIDHTFVSETLKGQGIGAQLVSAVATMAREEHARILPLCPFAEKVMTRSAEFADVLVQHVWPDIGQASDPPL